MEFVCVQFEDVGKIFYCKNPKELNVEKGNFCVVETKRGKELAKVIGFENEVPEGCEDVFVLKSLATERDLKIASENKERGKNDFDAVQELIYFCNIEKKLNKIEFLLDGEKVIVEIVSEERVDFRELVKKLTNKYKMKVEIRLVGSRDEFKTKGAIGPCGRECCCGCHIRNFEKITIKMAKNQNLSLSPTKISGACGKLMCCLSYENEEYVELAKTMPKINSIVKTPNGEGLVVYNDLFRQRVTVKIQTDNNKFETYEFEVSEIEFN